MALLEASGIGKNFGETKVLKDISLTLEQGEALAIIGSSGSGKTTLLRCLNFLERPDTGVIRVNGETMWDAADPATQRESEVRKKRLHFGLVFQNFNLFPQYTALENVMLAGELLAKEQPDYKANKKAIHAQLEAQARDLLAQMGLSERAGHYPHQLSGGQQQRVALARALVTRPSILLLDEPLSNLDAKLRVEMQVEIKRIQKELGITTIIVTHDHEEAVSLADRVIVMNAGHILQIGKPQEVFDRPASPFIADFMGFSTFLHGIAAGAEGDMRLIRCGAHTLQVPAEAAQELTEGDACILAIRSENIQTAEQEGANTVRGTVKSATYKGHTTRLEVSGCFEEMVYPAIHEYADVQEGSEVLLHFPAQHFCVYKDIK